MKNHVSIVIPTYKRSHLLKLLIQDIAQQTIQPDQLIIVDGDPESGEVKAVLQEQHLTIPITYVPSNHGNLPYQRYLGWRLADILKANIIVYFDDDERILQETVLKWLVGPFMKADTVGVGCEIQFGETLHRPGLSNNHRNKSRLSKFLGSGRNIASGGLTPTGHRKPLIDNQEEYIPTEWLRGGVMAFRMTAIVRDIFSDDLFAIYERRVGRAEDTFLSRRIGAHGKLLYTFRAVIAHPNADEPKAYAHEGFKYAYAATYSRRFLNDHYRVYESTKLVDRWALVKSYVGNTWLAWWRVVTKPSKLNLSFARGTTLGAFHGLTRPPTAKRLTPNIDWWADAEIAVKQAVEITQSYPQGTI